MNIAGLNNNFPLLEDLNQFQLSELSIFEGLVGLW